MNNIDEQNQPAGFSVSECEDRLIWDRVRRAAELEGETVELFCWRAIVSFVNCAEEEHMIFSPAGELIGDSRELTKLLHDATSDLLD